MEKLNLCPLCGTKDQKKIYEGVDEYYSKRMVQYVCCRACSLVFLNPRLTSDEYQLFYEKEFQNKRRDLNTVKESIERLEKGKSYEKKLRNMIYFSFFVQPEKRCLEIGAGWGTLAKVVQDTFFCSVKAIEPSHLAAQVAKEYYDIDCFAGTLEQFAAISNEKYDFIYFWHVFEHILDPNDFLQKIKNIISKDGVVLLALPNILSPDDRLTKFFHIEHCFYYSPTTLKYIFEKHGFELINLWNDKKVGDMKATFRLSDKNNKRINFTHDEYKKIKLTLNSIEWKYKLLRGMKENALFFLPQSLRSKVISFFVTLLRRLHIIH